VSLVVRVLAHGVPIGAAVLTSAVLSRRFREPDGLVEMVAQWGLLFAASTVVLLVVDRGAKRLLPLAALLKLSMLFPDEAPKRLRVARRSGSVRRLQERLDEAKALGADDEPTRAAEVILSLVGALHAHDRHTRGHSERVRWFSDLLADELKLPESDRDRLRWAALLHDIGKLEVSPKILNKPGRLVRREWRHIHRHPEAGARIVAPLSPWLGDWAETIAQHHEKYDGTGYPRRLAGNQICLGARIVAVADAYEVMTAARSYKKAASAAAARRELTASAGTHIDPAIVRAFVNISIGRLRWVSGPIAWVAQIPFIGWVPRVAEGAAALTGQAAGAASTAVLVSTGAAAAPPAAAAPEPEPVVIDTNVSNPVNLIGEITPTTAAASRPSASRSTAPQVVSSGDGLPAPLPAESATNAGNGQDGQGGPPTTAATPAAESRSDRAAVVSDLRAPTPAKATTTETDTVTVTTTDLTPSKAKRKG
jgi:putative nucleotidyltransferase with HDIG domain